MAGNRVAAESLAARRRRESRKEEWNEQTKLAALLSEYLGAATFWTSLENSPRSPLAGLMQKRRGTKPGLPDVIVLHGGQLVGVELKSKRGLPSRVQREVAGAIRSAGGRWWLARSARSALMALHLSGVPFRRRWKTPRLQAWEGPFVDPEQRLPQHPRVAREKREARRRWRARQRAREAARLEAQSAPVPIDRQPEAGDARA